MRFERAKGFLRTFRFRVMAWLFIIIVAMMVLSTVLIQAIVRRSIYEDFDRQLSAEIEEIHLAIRDLSPDRVPTPPRFTEEFVALRNFLERRARGRAYLHWFIRLYDTRGEEIYQSDAEVPPPPPPQRQRERTFKENTTLRWAEAAYPDFDRAWLWIQVGRSRVALQEDIDLLNFTLTLRAVVLLILAPIGGYFVARQVTEALAQIIGTASRLEPENLSERLPIRGTGDELDQVSATINGMLDRIAEYLDKNREFVANAAHELRSPLTAIRSSVEVALNRPRSSEEYVNVLSELLEEVIALSTMVNRLLLLAEGDAGRLAPGTQRAHLERVVRETLEMFQPVAELHGVELKLTSETPAEIAADEANLRHVVRNLVDNAIKFSPAQSQVEVSLRTAGPWAILNIRDHGEGISPEDLPRLFRRFFRGDKARHRTKGRTGTGLGLSICQAIVTALHGEIRVDSVPGKGSTFIVELPLAAEPAHSGTKAE